MKKSVKILAFALVLIMLCSTLASCGGLSGKYVNKGLADTILTFSGNKVDICFEIAGAEILCLDATYTIKDDKITFDFVSEDEENSVSNTIVKGLLSALEGELSFEKSDDTIKIGGVSYTKEK